MGHYAKVVNGIVEKVIVAKADFFNTFVDDSPGTWIKTSYNTRGGVHYQPNTDTPSEDQTKALRGNYAGVGHTYDSSNDVFYPPSPYDSWVLNETTWSWEAPVAYPEDDNAYEWNEDTQSWDQITITTDGTN